MSAPLFLCAIKVIASYPDIDSVSFQWILTFSGFQDFKTNEHHLYCYDSGNGVHCRNKCSAKITSPFQNAQLGTIAVWNVPDIKLKLSLPLYLW